MQAQMRRAADRRRVHKGRNDHVSVGEALAGMATVEDSAAEDDDTVVEHKVGPITVTGDGPLVVRAKANHAAPMTLDHALYATELGGPAFSLTLDPEHHRP